MEFGFQAEDGGDRESSLPHPSRSDVAATAETLPHAAPRSKCRGEATVTKKKRLIRKKSISVTQQEKLVMHFRLHR